MFTFFYVSTGRYVFYISYNILDTQDDMARWLRRQPLDRKVGGSRRPFSDNIFSFFEIIFAHVNVSVVSENGKFHSIGRGELRQVIRPGASHSMGPSSMHAYRVNHNTRLRASKTHNVI